ncbi:MAG: CHRD domain-containing protein [Gemmatimonadaceae bacterium]
MLPRPSATILVGAFTLIAVGCSSDHPRLTEVRAPIFEKSGASGTAFGDDGQLNTHLAGRNENPPRDTRAQGEAIFRLSDDGKSVEYRLIASNIDNPFMAHIHMAPVGVNGPIVVWLYPSTAPVPGPAGSGRHDGELSHGTFTAANFVGPLAGHSLVDLLSAIASGNAYVNVHTNDGVHPANSGAGNFPGGEIRGQLTAKNDADDDEKGDDARVIKMLDDCDPASFNAAVGPGSCVGNGKTTFQSFLAELQATHVAAKWEFIPSMLEAEGGGVLMAKNLGGEQHTFTAVAQYGGGIVPTLNAASNNPIEAAECKTLEADDFVSPGGTYKAKLTKDAIQRFQCCIHPWMRTTVQREH